MPGERMVEAIARESVPLIVHVVIFALYRGECCFLVTRPQETDRWCLPGSTISMREDTLEATAKRVVTHYLPGEIPYLEQVETLGGQRGETWSVAVVYYALVCLRSKGAGKHWMSIREFQKASFAFDYQLLIAHCVTRFRNKALYTSLPLFLLPEEFTLTEVQKAYERIVGFRIEKKSFRRRLLDTPLLQETGNLRRASHRPAQLYRLHHVPPYFFARMLEGGRQNKGSDRGTEWRGYG